MLTAKQTELKMMDCETETLPESRSSSGQELKALSEMADLRKPLKEIVDLRFKHPLEHTWTLWYLENDRSKSWEDMQNEITSFDMVEDFWSLYNHIKPPSEIKIGSDYSLFKKGIQWVHCTPPATRCCQFCCHFSDQCGRMMPTSSAVAGSSIWGVAPNWSSTSFGWMWWVGGGDLCPLTVASARKRAPIWQSPTSISHFRSLTATHTDWRGLWAHWRSLRRCYQLAWQEQQNLYVLHLEIHLF